MKIRDDVARMLRAGTPYRKIKAELHVSHATIVATRKALRIDLVRPAPLTQLAGDELRAAIEERYPQVAAMLRAGATLQEISDVTGVSPPTSVKVRRILGIPTPQRGMQARSIGQTIDRYLEHHGDGHARWTGPFANGQPQLWANGRCYAARREIFRSHHGRTPEGTVRTTCTQPGCIAGAHLADRIHRQAEQQLDAQYAAIFGPEAP
ncbi:hypothetical protein AB0N31_10565 [Streptomyces sp. NPDC051051]|uniref:hypothetical protein n=1 Tax=Streptomyces sp. NPDC051051 TaxID=3155666 RepID=UPI0034254DB8